MVRRAAGALWEDATGLITNSDADFTVFEIPGGKFAGLRVEDQDGQMHFLVQRDDGGDPRAADLAEFLSKTSWQPSSRGRGTTR